MTIWEITAQTVFNKEININENNGMCRRLEKILNNYVDDPMSENAPSECLDLIREKHIKHCPLCQHIRRMKWVFVTQRT